MSFRKPRVTKKDLPQLLTAEDRKRLPPRKTPYYQTIGKGLSLGLAKGAKGSVWKVRQSKPRLEMVLGAPEEDAREDSYAILTFTDEAIAVFHHIIRDRDPEEFIFLKANGKPWGRNHQARPMEDCAEAVDIDITFYSLRHTCITTWLLNGVDVAIVASAVGTSTAMIEKHYKNPRVGSLAETLNQKVPQVGSYSQEVEGDHLGFRQVQAGDPGVYANQGEQQGVTLGVRGAFGDFHHHPVPNGQAPSPQVRNSTSTARSRVPPGPWNAPFAAVSATSPGRLPGSWGALRSGDHRPWPSP